MRFVIQRVNSASVSVDDKVIGSIGKGYLILFGAGEGDTKEMLVPYADKIAKMRIFADENEKTNLSINDVNGEILVVSQFTLYADCRKGNRPSFVHACEQFLPMNCMKSLSGCADNGYQRLKQENSVHI